MLPSYHPYQALAEAEEMLVKCHALCDPTGLAAGDNDGGGGDDPTGEKCVIDCAAARMHGEAFSKGGKGGEGGEQATPQAEETKPQQQQQQQQQQEEVRQEVKQEVKAAPADWPEEPAQVLLKCHGECAASGDASSSTCTIACAQRHLEANKASKARAKAGATPKGSHYPKSQAASTPKEAEAILVECHGLCDPKGLVFKGLYDASGTPEQCTIDCAAARLHGETFAGRDVAGWAPPKKASTSGAKGEGEGEGERAVSEAAQVLIQCHPPLPLTPYP